jgi:hypothetical protein
MEFKDRYVSISEKDKIENKDKKIISEDAFALGEVIEDLKNKLEHLRITFIK